MNAAERWLLEKQPTFNGYSHYLKYLYGAPVYRVAVDAGFSCPNRGPDRSRPGCLYCNSRGSKATYLGDTAGVEQQVQGAIAFLKKRYKAEKYILYFQAFTNTYGAPETLKSLYDQTLTLAPFKELVVSTRPDCLGRETADLLAGYHNAGLTTWVELGLQSASDHTLQLVGRGHTVADFCTAFTLLRQRGIRIAVHVIFGLPGEGTKEILDTIRLLAELNPEGIKIHNLHIARETLLYEDFLAGEILAPTQEQHLEYVIAALELLPPRTVIMRVTCDTPPDLLASPRRFWDKALFYRKLRETMLRRGTRQGRLYKTALTGDP